MRPRYTISTVMLASLMAAVATRYISNGFWKFAPDESLEEAGRAGVADAAMETASIASLEPAERKNSWQRVALDMPKAPLKGQKRAPCRPKGEVEISRACWVQVGSVSPPCGEDWYEWKGFCYVPVLAPERPNTSMNLGRDYSGSVTPGGQVNEAGTDQSCSNPVSSVAGKNTRLPARTKGSGSASMICGT